MADTIPFKRLTLRAVLRHVSPMVIRLVSVSDRMPLTEFHDVFRAILGWNGDLDYLIRVHGQEFNRFRRRTRSNAWHEFKLHRQEKFQYIVGDAERQTIPLQLEVADVVLADLAGHQRALQVVYPIPGVEGVGAVV